MMQERLELIKESTTITINTIYCLMCGARIAFILGTSPFVSGECPQCKRFLYVKFGEYIVTVVVDRKNDSG